MTTVGYGNQSTTSVAGRALVYVLGFISILFFGGILANTGSIVSHLVGDFFARLRIKFLTYKSVMIFIWGFLWLGWMAGKICHLEHLPCVNISSKRRNILSLKPFSK